MPRLDPPESVAVMSRLTAPLEPLAVAMCGVAVLATAGLAGWFFGVFGDPGLRDSERLLSAIMVTAFAGMTLLFATQLLRQWQRERYRTNLQGWRRDHWWDERGTPDDSRRELREAPLVLVAIGLFLAMMNLGFGTADGPKEAGWVALAILAPFNLAWGYGLWRLLGRLAQWRRFGFPALRYKTLAPYRPGQKIELWLDASPALSGPVSVELRCVEETLEGFARASSRGPGRAVRHRSVAVWREAFEASVDSRGQAHLVLTLPPDAPGTQLDPALYPPLRYWEVLVRAPRAGADYEGVFLLPVYA